MLSIISYQANANQNHKEIYFTHPPGSLSWEPPYAMGSGPRKGKKTKKINNNNRTLALERR